MKTLNILIVLLLLSCGKEEPVTIQGNWITGEIVYSFGKDLTITEDGLSETYKYSISNDTIYLDYGLPFVIQNITQSDLILSKNDGQNLYIYKFKKIDY